MRLLNKKRKLYLLLSGFLIAGLTACGGGGEQADTQSASAEKEVPAKSTSETVDTGIGVGPIKNVALGEINPEMVTEGKAIFEGKCSACHKVEERYIGPPMKGVTERRKPEWVMNMILNPEEMVKKDPQAKALLAEYMAPMADQNLTEDEARKILEYFRTLK
ncbi:MAG: c-type cytochrome [Candidatus Cyclobacteriaceae bacterium M2_1C_046]